MGNETFAVRLVLVGGEFGASDIELGDTVTFGRGRDVDVRINHPLVSRRHCSVEPRDGAVFVKDLGSLNGTFVGSVRVEVETQLPPDGLLTIGAVTFRAVYSFTEAKSSNCRKELTDFGRTDLRDNMIQPDSSSLAETVLNPQYLKSNPPRRPEH